MKRSGPLKRRTPLRRSSWFDEVAALPEAVKTGGLQRTKRLKPRRAKPRRDGQHRDRAHLDRVKALGYCSAHVLLGVTGCWMSIIDPDHLGPKPGKGIRCDDRLSAPHCRRCHSWREDRQGCFKGWSNEKMEAYAREAIALAEYHLNMETMGGHGRRRSVA